LNFEGSSVDLEGGDAVGVLEEADGEEGHVKFRRRPDQEGRASLAVIASGIAPVETHAQQTGIPRGSCQVALVVDPPGFLLQVDPDPVVHALDLPAVDLP